MVISTTSSEDAQGIELLDEFYDNAILVGKGELHEDDLPTPQVLWEKLCKILNVDA